MLRVRKITLPDGTDPFFVDGRIIPTAMPQFTTLYMGKQVFQDGNDFQAATPREFSFTFTGQLIETSIGRLRTLLASLDGALGLRNRRFYLYDDRFWFVRSEGMRALQPHPGVRDRHVSIELYLRAMDPYLRDDAGTVYQAF